MPIDDALLEILVCPQCKGSLDYDQELDRLECQKCQLAYPIKDGIPVMLPDKSIKLDEKKG